MMVHGGEYKIHAKINHTWPIKHNRDLTVVGIADDPVRIRNKTVEVTYGIELKSKKDTLEIILEWYHHGFLAIFFHLMGQLGEPGQK